MASDIVALNENLWKIPFIFELVNKANTLIYINLAWSFAYNVLMIPMAAGLFEPIGLHLSPLVSSASMSGSSIIVVLFSSLLRFYRFKEPTPNKTSIKVNDIQSSKMQFNKNTRHNKKLLSSA